MELCNWLVLLCVKNQAPSGGRKTRVILLDGYSDVELIVQVCIECLYLN